MLTVLIATRNRAEMLAGVLEALGELQSPAGGWTLVVVVTQSAFRQFAPHETLAQQGARADELARR